MTRHDAGAFSAILVGLLTAVTALGESERLWYAAPAVHWNEALPVGNGRLGAMVFGGAPEERLQFNEQTLWTGADGTQRWLDASRSDERTRDGAIGAYQPFGDLYLKFPAGHAERREFRRQLDLSTGVAGTQYRVGEVLHTRAVFASRKADVVVVRIAADRPGSVSFRMRLSDAARLQLTRAATVAAETRAGERELSFAGAFTKPTSAPAGARQFNGMKYEARVRVLNDGGRVEVIGDELEVTGADAVTLLLSAATDYKADPTRGYRGEAPGPKVAAALAAAVGRSFGELLAEHVRDHQSLYGRVSLTLPVTANSELPTDRRLQAYTKGAADPALEALVFHYGRYLLMSSSRPGGLPANLQGLWNADPEPAWYSGYTNNINLEMNYWLAETTNLAECAEPLFDYIDQLAGAQKLNPDPKLQTPLGWVIYSTNNPLGGNSGWAIHMPGSAWLSQHLYEAWAFGGDEKFLRERAYPHLRELTRMWDARLVMSAEGKLITPDGWSPEHGPVRMPDGKIEIRGGDRTPQPGASYDQQIVYDLFSNFIDASVALGADSGLREHIVRRREQLLGPKVGRWGQLQEWMEDVDDPKNKHRHVSHMFAVHPGRQVSPLTTPEFAAAARVSLDARGDGSTGWARAWKLAHWARLHDGDRAHKLARGYLTALPGDPKAHGGKIATNGGTLPNLFCAHPPFQIDGNFGFTAGVAEMLLQSHMKSPEGRRLIHLLPAVPEAWAKGEVRGLRARDGFTVDLAWENGKVTSATIHSRLGKPFRVYHNGAGTDHEVAAGESLRWPVK